LSPNQLGKARIGFLSFVPKINLEDLIYLLILLLLPTQLGRHFWPSFSYISGVRVDYLSPTLYITDVLILLLLFLVFIKSSRNGTLKNIKKQKKLVIHLVLVSIFVIMNIVFSRNPMVAIYGTLKLFEFIFFGIFSFYKIPKVKKEVLVSLFSATVIGESIIGIFQYVKQSSVGGLLYFLGERTFNGQTPGIANISIDGELILRAYGTFSHPNVFAGFLLLFLVLILFNLKLRKIIGALYICALTIGSIALLLTFSRIAIVLWVISVFIFILSKIKMSLFKRVLVSVIILISLIASSIFYTPFYLRFFQSSPTEDSFVIREKLVMKSFEKVKESPIIGAGLNNYFSGFISSENVFLLQPVHNIFLLILVQTGIVGIIYSLWFLYKTCLKVFKKKLLYLKLLFFYIIILGLFDHYFLTLQQGQLLLSFLVGFLWSKND